MTTNQYESPVGTITTIEIGRMSNGEGMKLKELLGGKTYMKFEVIVAPAGGEWMVSAQTNYDGSVDEILGMFIYLMATETLSIARFVN